MRPSTLTRAALFALLCLCAQALFAAIGTIDSFEGDVRVVSTKDDRAAKAGMELSEGDTVKTGANAWALLAMTDGASMTLRQNSQLRLDTYRFDPDGDAKNNSSLLSLVKGAFRSVTGLIGRSNRDGYRITTPTATIGIRGTDHEPAYYPPPGPGETLDHEPGTYDKVNDGESFIKNPKGEIAVKRGQYAFVQHDARVAPRLLARPPAFYQRHAAFDKRAAVRRQEFHRKFEQQYQRRMQERRDKPEPRKAAQERKGELNEKKKAEMQQQRRELIEKRQEERKAQQENKKEERAEELKKRQAQQEHMKQERAEALKKHQQELARKKQLEDEKKEHLKKH